MATYDEKELTRTFEDLQKLYTHWIAQNHVPVGGYVEYAARKFASLRNSKTPTDTEYALANHLMTTKPIIAIQKATGKSLPTITSNVTRHAASAAIKVGASPRYDVLRNRIAENILKTSITTPSDIDKAVNELAPKVYKYGATKMGMILPETDIKNILGEALASQANIDPTLKDYYKIIDKAKQKTQKPVDENIMPNTLDVLAHTLMMTTVPSYGKLSPEAMEEAGGARYSKAYEAAGTLGEETFRYTLPMYREYINAAQRKQIGGRLGYALAVPFRLTGDIVRGMTYDVAKGMLDYSQSVMQQAGERAAKTGESAPVALAKTTLSDPAALGMYVLGAIGIKNVPAHLRSTYNKLIRAAAFEVPSETARGVSGRIASFMSKRVPQYIRQFARGQIAKSLERQMKSEMSKLIDSANMDIDTIRKHYEGTEPLTPESYKIVEDRLNNKLEMLDTLTKEYRELFEGAETGTIRGQKETIRQAMQSDVAKDTLKNLEKQYRVAGEKEQLIGVRKAEETVEPISEYSQKARQYAEEARPTPKEKVEEQAQKVSRVQEEVQTVYEQRFQDIKNKVKSEVEKQFENENKDIVQEAVNKLNTQKENLNSKLKTLEKSLESDIAQKDKAIQTLRQKIEENKIDTEFLKEFDPDEQQKIINATAKSIKENVKTIHENEGVIKTLRNKLNQEKLSKSERDKIINQKRELLNKNKELRAQNAEHNKTINSIKSNIRKYYSQKKAFDKIDSQIKSIETTKNDIVNRYELLKRDIQSTITDIEQKISSEQEQSKVVSEQEQPEVAKTEPESELTARTTSELSDETKEILRQVEEEDFVKKQEELTKLETQAEVQRNRINELTKLRQELSEKLSANKSRLSRLTQERQVLKAEKKGAALNSKTYLENAKKISETDKKIAIVEADIEALTSKIKKIDNNIATLKSSVRETERNRKVVLGETEKNRAAFQQSVAEATKRVVIGEKPVLETPASPRIETKKTRMFEPTVDVSNYTDVKTAEYAKIINNTDEEIGKIDVDPPSSDNTHNASVLENIVDKTDTPEEVIDIINKLFNSDDITQKVTELKNTKKWDTAKREAVEIAKRIGISEDKIRQYARRFKNEDSAILALSQTIDNCTNELIDALKAYVSDKGNINKFNALVERLSKLQMAKSAFVGTKTEVGRALNICKLTKETQKFVDTWMSQGNRENVMSILSELFSDTENTALQLSKKQIDKFAEAFEKYQNNNAALKLELYNTIGRLNKYTFWDLLDTYRYFNMLSSIATHTANISGNITMHTVLAIDEAIASAIDTGIAAVAKRLGKQYTPKHTLAGIADTIIGYRFGMTPAIKNAKIALQYGISPTSKFDLSHVKIIDVPILRGMQRLGFALSASDTIFYVTKLYSELYRLAKQSCRSRGLQGEALIKEAIDLMKDPTPEMLMAAKKIASEAILQPTPGAIGKKLMNLLNAQIPEDVKVFGGMRPLKFIQPFITIAYGMVRTGIEHSPLGLARVFGKAFREDPAMHLAKIMLGTTTMYYLYQLSENGILTTGRPRDPKKREEFDRLGKVPFSLKVGNHYFRLDEIPVANWWVYAVSAINDRIDEREETNLERLKRGLPPLPDRLVASDILPIIGKLVNDSITSPMYGGISAMIDAIDDISNAGINSQEQFNQFMFKILSQFYPARAAAFSAERAFGTGIKRQPKTIWEHFKSSYPYLASTVRPRLDILGRPLKYQQANPSAFFTRLLSPVEYKDNILDKGLAELETPILDIGRRVGNITLDDDEYYRYRLEVASKWRDILTRIFTSQSYQNLLSDIKSISDPIERKQSLKRLRDEIVTSYLSPIKSQIAQKYIAERVKRIPETKLLLQ